MATSKEYLNFVLEQLSTLPDITHKQMMYEYMIYYRGRLASYLCSDRFCPVSFLIEALDEVAE